MNRPEAAFTHLNKTAVRLKKGELHKRTRNDFATDSAAQGSGAERINVRPAGRRLRRAPGAERVTDSVGGRSGISRAAGGA